VKKEKKKKVDLGGLPQLLNQNILHPTRQLLCCTVRDVMESRSDRQESRAATYQAYQGGRLGLAVSI
jgi:hypothetical protein